MKVIKRDGSLQDFNPDHIRVAVQKATNEAGVVDGGELAQRTTEEVEKALDKDRYHVFEIQAYVENTLLQLNPAVAKRYIGYRANRDLERANIKDSIRKLIDQDPTVVNENANKDSRAFNTIRDLMAGSVAKPVGLSMLPPSVAEAHERGDIHWHDLDYSPFTPYTNCCVIDFKELFKGYKMGSAEVETPKSVETAISQMTQIILNIAGSQYGGQTVNRIDELLEPYVEMNFKKNVKDLVITEAEFAGEELTDDEVNARVDEVMKDFAAV